MASEHHEAVAKILELIQDLKTDRELQDVIVRARTIREERLQEIRRQVRERQRPAKEEVDSSRERT